MGDFLGLGEVASGVLNYFGAQQASNKNVQLGHEQMQFQERMRNTAYQAAVADLKKAGLNPALAYSQGGAAVPQGSLPHVENKWGAAAEGVRSYMATRAEAEVHNAQVGLITSQKAEADSSAEKNAADAAYTRAMTPWVGQQATAGIDTQRSTQALQGAQAALASADAARANQAIEQSKKEMSEIQARIENLGKEGALLKQDLQWKKDNYPLLLEYQKTINALKKSDLPAARAEAAKASTWWGRYVSPYISDVGTVLGAVATAAGSFGGAFLGSSAASKRGLPNTRPRDKYGPNRKPYD